MIYAIEGECEVRRDLYARCRIGVGGEFGSRVLHAVTVDPCLEPSS